MDTEQSTEATEGEATAAEPVPEPVTRAEFDSLKFDLTAARDREKRLMDLLEARQAPAPQSAPADAAEPDIVITDDDEGDVRTAKLFERGIRPLRQQLEQLTNIGFGTLSKIGERTVVNALSVPDREIYNRFRPEVDRYMGALSTAQRAQPESLEHVLKMVKGAHYEELRDEAIEMSSRQLVKTAKPGPPPARGEKPPATTNSPIVPEDLFDGAQCRAIEARGGPDAFARKLGYKDWASYAELARKWQNKE